MVHEIQYTDACAKLEVFGRLAPSSRLALIQTLPTTSMVGERFGEDLEPLLEAEILQWRQDGRRVWLRPEFHPLHVLLRAAQQCAVLEEGSSSSAIRVYVLSTLSRDLREEVLGNNALHLSNAATALATEANKPTWVTRALEPAACARWKKSHERGYAKAKPIYTPAIRKALARVVESLVKQGCPAPVEALPQLAGTKTPKTLNAVFQAGLRYLILFPGLDPVTGLPVLGLVPSISELRGRGEAVLPELHALEMEPIPGSLVPDMYRMLVAVAGGHIRVRTDRRIFKKDSAALLNAMPRHAPAARHLLQRGRPNRLNLAVAVASDLSFLKVGPDADGRKRLVTTPAARAWLALDTSQRILDTLESLSPKAGVTADPHNDEDWYLAATLKGQISAGSLWNGVFRVLSASLPAQTDALALRESCLDVLRQLPRGDGVEYAAFLEYASRAHNPLLGAGPLAKQLAAKGAKWRGQVPQRDLELAWRSAIQRATQEYLGALGGLRVALCDTPEEDAPEDGRPDGSVPQDGLDPDLIIGLSPVGEWLLGLRDAYPDEATDDRRVVVQPTFEIVFLAPDPSANAELSTFCDRLGDDVGVLFEITKASIARAAAAGMTVDVIIDTLDRVSMQALPSNVRTEIRTWHGRQRVIALARPWVLRCGDADTAARVMAAAPRKLERISDDLVMVRGTTKPETIGKLLAKHGITIDTSGVPKPKKRAAPRRRRYW